MNGSIDQANAGRFDVTVLPALLGRLSPGVAVQFRSQFVTDLANLQDSLVAALAAPGDGTELLRTVHVLAALAGTAGDAGLADQAREVSDLLRAGNPAAAIRKAAGLGALIDALVAYVAGCPVPGAAQRP